MSRSRTGWGLIVATFAVSYALAVAPLPSWAEAVRPYWSALVLIYWCIEAPERVGIGTAFGLGLGLDVLTGTLIGAHALGLVIIAFIVLRFRRRLRFYPLWQQALVVLALLVNDRVVALWIKGLADAGLPDWHFWTPPLVAMVLWPWVFLLLDDLRLRRREK